MTSNRSRIASIGIAAMLQAFAIGAANAQTPPAGPAPPAAKPASSGTEALDAKIAALFSPSGLTADAVASRAESTSYDVKAKQAELEAASALVNGAILNFLPRVKLSASATKLSYIAPPSFGSIVVAPGTGTNQPVLAGQPLENVELTIPVINHQYILEAMLVLPISDYVLRTSQTYAAASHSESAARLDERAARLKVASDARVLYYGWARAKLQIIVAAQALDQANLHAEDARHRFDAGSSSKADVMRVESQLASSRLLLERAKNLEVVFGVQVRTAMHDMNIRLDAIGEDLSGKLNALPDEGDAAGLFNEAMSRRLEIRSLDETAWSLKDQAKVARAGYLPRIDGIADVTYANPNQRFFPPADQFNATWSVGAALTWSLNDIASSSVSARQLDAKAAQIEAQKESIKEGLGIEVAMSLQALRDAEAAIDTTAQGLAAAEESYRVRRELFRNAQATSAELTDAETDLTQARLASINARVDLRIARARLLHATGRDVGSATP